ncbi:MAG TPA: STAS domain-containing protein [Terriglobia bacterium]|nr:STAS domain-containing protein [Terriglobia bacterium]
MALHIAEKDWGGVTVLALSGRVVLGEESSQLRNKIRAILGQGKKHIVLDLGDVSYIDSAGLGTLVAGYTTASSQGGTIKLANLTKRFEEQLNITKLVTVFDVHNSVDEAVMSFKLADEAKG